MDDFQAHLRSILLDSNFGLLTVFAVEKNSNNSHINWFRSLESAWLQCECVQFRFISPLQLAVFDFCCGTNTKSKANQWRTQSPCLSQTLNSVERGIKTIEKHFLFKFTIKLHALPWLRNKTLWRKNMWSLTRSWLRDFNRDFLLLFCT